MTLEVDPGRSATSYAIEERLFNGFTAAGITGSGTFLPGEAAIRWGPFFDNQPRTVTYTLAAPAAFDGEDFPVAGQAVVRFGSSPFPPPVQTDLDGDRMAIEIAGPLNARVIVETSDAIGGL